MKKILVYYDSMNPKGGIERVLANLFNMVCKDYEVTVLTCDDLNSSYELSPNIARISMFKNRELNMNKSRVYRIRQILKSLLFNHKFLKKIVDDFDYIYIATPLTALELYLLGKKVRRKTVVSEHASYYACNRVYKMIRKIVYPKMYIVSVPTKTDTQMYLKNSCNAIYIPHLSTFNADEKNFVNNKIALNVGRLTNDKQQILLLKIWKKLKEQKKLNGWSLRIVGEGELRTVLEEYILENDLSDCVTLVSITSRIDLEYANANLFLFTSKMEGFGMVLLEAMAFGVPCISFDCHSGPRDIIKNNYNGYLIDCYDEEKYSSTIDKVINNEELLDELSKNAYKTINEWDNESIIKLWKMKIFE